VPVERAQVGHQLVPQAQTAFRDARSDLQIGAGAWDAQGRGRRRTVVIAGEGNGVAQSGVQLSLLEHLHHTAHIFGLLSPDLSCQACHHQRPCRCVLQPALKRTQRLPLRLRPHDEPRLRGRGSLSACPLRSRASGTGRGLPQACQALQKRPQQMHDRGRRRLPKTLGRRGFALALRPQSGLQLLRYGRALRGGGRNAPQFRAGIERSGLHGDMRRRRRRSKGEHGERAPCAQVEPLRRVFPRGFEARHHDRFAASNQQQAFLERQTFAFRPRDRRGGEQASRAYQRQPRRDGADDPNRRGQA
jgi:hypothetical protein